MSCSSRPRGRPRGEIRTALASWAATCPPAECTPALTIEELAQHVPGLDVRSRGEHRLIIYTVMAMVRAGELVRTGTRPLQFGERGRPRAVYAPARANEATPADFALLAAALRPRTGAM